MPPTSLKKGTHILEAQFIQQKIKKLDGVRGASGYYAGNLNLKAQLCKAAEGWVGPAISNPAELTKSFIS